MEINNEIGQLISDNAAKIASVKSEKKQSSAKENGLKSAGRPINPNLRDVMSYCGGITSEEKKKSSSENGKNGVGSNIIKTTHFESIFPHALKNNEFNFKHVIGKTENGKNRTYNPDYYCEEIGCYIECATSLPNISTSGPIWRKAIETGLKLEIYWWEGQNITKLIMDSKLNGIEKRDLEKIVGHQVRFKPNGIPMISDPNYIKPSTIKEYNYNKQKFAGSMRSERKTAACRENAKLGGWPKGKPRKKPPETPQAPTPEIPNMP